ncbi:MAG: hypothetical protein EOM20_07740 [Spartobacteria bacterium]|nr:hypothetical protein [Spartobacteria bacterium]
MRDGRWLAENKWFILGLCFLALNGAGVVLHLQTQARIAAACTLNVDIPEEQEPLRLVNVRQYTSFQDGGIGLLLEWNRTVSVASLPPHMSITNSEGRGVAWTNVGRLVNRALMIRTAPTKDGVLNLQIVPGVMQLDDGLGLVACVQTNVWCSHTVHLIKMKPHSEAYSDGSLTCEFSQPINMEKALRYISTEPEVALTIDHYGARWNQNKYRLSGKFQPGQVYMVTLKAGLPGVVSGALTNTLVKHVRFPDRPADLSAEGGGVYLASSSEKLLPVKSVNVTSLHVVARNVFPNNLVPFAMRQTDGYRYFMGNADDGLGRILSERDYPIDSVRNEIFTASLPMDELVQDNGIYIVEVSASSCASIRRLVVLTDLGLTVKRSSKDMLVWLNSLQELTAVSGAVVRVFTRDNQEVGQGCTDALGLLSLPGVYEGEDAPFLVTASTGADMTYLVMDDGGVALGNHTGRPWLDSGYEAFLFTERGVYRPAETAHVSAVIREVARTDQAASSNGFYVCPPRFPVELYMRTPQGKERCVGKGIPDELGTITFEVAWAMSEPTGNYQFMLRVSGSERDIGHAGVAVEDFAPPTIAVQLSPACSNLTQTSHCRVQVQANRLSGEPAGGHRVDAQVFYEAADFTHPDWEGYSFSDAMKTFSSSTVKLETKRLDDDGRSDYLVEAPRQGRPPSRVQAVLQATVHEFGGRTVSARAGIPVDVYPFYIGMRQIGSRVIHNTDVPAVFDVVAVTPEGVCMEGEQTLAVTHYSVEWVSALKRSGDGYAWESEKRCVPVAHAALILTNGVGRYEGLFSGQGMRIVRIAEVESDVSASVECYVAGDNADWMSWGGDHPAQIKMTWDKPVYQPGETALLRVVAPFAGKALLTIESDRVLASELIAFNGNTRELQVPITEDYWPNVQCTMALIKPLVTNDPGAVYRAAGRIPLRVNLPATHIRTALYAPPEIRPDSEVTITGCLYRADGRPASGRVFLMAVDEAICMLTGFGLPDPDDFFAAWRLAAVTHFDVYARLMPIWSSNRFERISSPGGDAGSPLKSRLNPINAQRFKPVSLWGGLQHVDTNGCFTWKARVPEFSGSLRVVAVAVDSNAWGAARTSICVKRPFDVQCGAPRFLAPGDRCRAPFRVRVDEGWTQAVAVKVSCAGPMALGTDGAQTLSWRCDPAIDGVGHTRMLDLMGGDIPGRAELILEARSGDEVYRETIELTVRPPYGFTTRRGAGHVDAGGDVIIELPDGWIDGTGEGAVACCGLPELTYAGALDYLLEYPYGCIEQTVSKTFPLLYLDARVPVTHSQSGQGESVDLLVVQGLWKVIAMQQVSGGFAYWAHSTDVYPWGSVYATHLLIEAAARGFDVPPGVLDNALMYLQGLLSNPSAGNEWGALRLYACYVLALAGKPVGEWSSFFLQQSDLGREGQVYLAATLAMQGRAAEAMNLLARGGGYVPDFKSQRRAGALSSEARITAFELMTWLRLDPGNGAIPVLAQKLLAARENGCWASTQDNAMALLALGRYYDLIAGQSMDFEASLVCDNRAMTFDRFSSNVVFTFRESWPDHVALSNAGPGTVYYYWSASGVPVSNEVQEVSRGIHITRAWFDQEGFPVEPSALRRGDVVVIEWRLRVETELNDIVIEDLLPACFEIEQAGLATSAHIPWMKKRVNLPLRHVETRDDRVVGFTGPVCGEYIWSYVVRVVSAGNFVYPAIQAEAMYEPGYAGCSGGGRTLDIGGL